MKAAPSTWARGRKSSADVTREIVKSKGCFDILRLGVEEVFCFSVELGNGRK